ncbi:MAG: hypothetical protein WBL50_04835 [Candidatus Acidiferrum sp.]
MFKQSKLTVRTLTSIINYLFAAEHGEDAWEETDLKQISREVATAMLEAENFEEFDKIYDQIDIRTLHLHGPAAFQKQFLKKAKKKHS